MECHLGNVHINVVYMCPSAVCQVKANLTSQIRKKLERFMTFGSPSMYLVYGSTKCKVKNFQFQPIFILQHYIVRTTRIILLYVCKLYSLYLCLTLRLRDCKIMTVPT